MPALAGFARVVAIATLVALVGLQLAGMRVSSRFQEWTTAVKFVAFLAVIVAALMFAPGIAGGVRPRRRRRRSSG